MINSEKWEVSSTTSSGTVNVVNGSRIAELTFSTVGTAPGDYALNFSTGVGFDTEYVDAILVGNLNNWIINVAPEPSVTGYAVLACAGLLARRRR